MRVRVIGIGTPHGDDAAGLAAVAALQAGGLPAGVDATTCQRPGLDLPSALAGVQAAVLIDAMCSDDAPGQVARLSRAELPRLRAVSSHGLGVAEGLALAEALGRAPAHLELLGVTLGRAAGPRLSAAARQGAERAATLARELAAALARRPAALAEDADA